MAAIRDLMTQPRAVPAETGLAEACELMGKWHVGTLIVTRDGRPAGLVTDRDLALRALLDAAPGEDPPVGEAASEPLVSVGPEASVEEAAHLMRKERIRRLAVMEGADELVGVVAADDLLRHLGRRVHALAAAVSQELDREANPVDNATHGVFGKE